MAGAFQYENDWYPDVDDTAAVITAMAKIHQAETPDFDDVLQRGFHWVLAMQGF